ncbi:hypothetical protein GGI35DRAFT_481558 [Trichoderma velutinum]
MKADYEGVLSKSSGAGKETSAEWSKAKTAKFLKADDGMLSCWLLYGLGRRSNVADRRQCDGQSVSMLGSRKLGEISGTALLLLQMQMQLRRHAHEKHGRGPMESRQSQAGQGEATIGHEGWPQRLFLAVQASQIPSSSGAAEGLRSPLGLAVEDERLPWFLEAPSGEG